METKETREIPFIKAVRLGNFKLWRTKKVYKSGKDKSEIETLNISDLDGGWQVKIPATVHTYKLFREMYESDNEELHGALVAMINNIYYSSIVTNGYFHKALQLCSTIYVAPESFINKGKPTKELKKYVKILLRNFWEWRKGYNDMVATLQPTKEDMDHDQTAEEILEEIDRDDK